MSEETMTNNTTEETEETPEASVSGATGEAEEAGEVWASLLTADQAAERLGITTRRLRDWRKEGKLTEVGRFKRGTANVPLFDPTDVDRLQHAEEAEEAPASAVTPVTSVASIADPALFAAAVAHQVRLLIAERAEAEAAAVAPLVKLVEKQQATIDMLRQEAAAADQRAKDAEAQVAAQKAKEQKRIDDAAEAIRARNAALNVQTAGSMMRGHVEREADRRDASKATSSSDRPSPSDQQGQGRTFWKRVLARFRGEN